jgi:hypothetical protein
MPSLLKLEKWRTEHGEDGPDKVKLAVPAETTFTQMQPGSFARPSEKDAEGLGADVTKLRKPGQ